MWLPQQHQRHIAQHMSTVSFNSAKDKWWVKLSKTNMSIQFNHKIPKTKAKSLSNLTFIIILTENDHSVRRPWILKWPSQKSGNCPEFIKVFQWSSCRTFQGHIRSNYWLMSKNEADDHSLLLHATEQKCRVRNQPNCKSNEEKIRDHSSHAHRGFWN